VGEDRRLDLTTRGYFGKDFHYPDRVRTVMRRGEGLDKAMESEVVAMSPFFQRAVADLIEVRSSSGNIAIRRRADDDFTDSRVSFSLSQPDYVAMGNQMDTLLVTVPVAFRIDPARAAFCQSKNQVDPRNAEDSVFDHIPEDAFGYTFETLAIPVYLEAATEPFQLQVDQVGDQLQAEVRFSAVALLDTGASWFEFLGETYWFHCQGDTCVARGPAREGTVHYTIGATHRTAEFLNLQGVSGATRRTLITEGDMAVCLDPPVIRDFRYDRETNTLAAHIDDRGTPLENLSIELQLDGNRLEADFDTQNGKLSATLPTRPPSVLTASLQVTDRADQTAAATCPVFGEAAPEGAPEAVHASVDGLVTNSPNRNDVANVLGTTGDGKAIVEICETVMKWGYFRNGRFVPVCSEPGAARLAQVRPRDPHDGYDLRNALSRHLPLDFEILGQAYDRRFFEAIPPGGGGVSSLSAATAQSAAASGRNVYFVATAQDGQRAIPLNDAVFGFGLFFTLKETMECHTEARDILAPDIRPVFDPATQLLRAAIHDHGMPLSELEIDVAARSDPANSIADWGAHLSSTGSRPAFNFREGILTCRFVPPAEGEFFILRIAAQDKAGNRSFVDVDVVIPREPPDVNLAAEVRQSNQFVTRNAVHASAYLTGQASDSSRIIPEKTTLWLDDQTLHPFMRYSHTPEAGWRSQFNYKACYAAGVDEGPHSARLRATDATGLWAEATTAFDYNLAPYIYDFKVMPDAVRRIGGPALTAMILDPGGDLDIGGLALTIDGQPVDPAHFYFDPTSGYFSLDGPLELADGTHRAEITAIDGHGNQSSDSLRFTRAAEITTAFRDGGQGVFIESLTLMELEDHNGNGRANPGELVRLFITLHNDTDDDLACAAGLSSEDPQIVVETERVGYGHMAPGSSVAPMKGYDLRVGRDILDKTISDPFEAYFDLTVDCASQADFALPLTLPIYRPSLPVDTGITIAMDRLPPTTPVDTIRVQGTVVSEAEFIDWVEMRVNGVLQGPVTFNRDGGRFEVVAALSDGANTIEVSAADSSGDRGSAAGYVFRTVSFTPPTIAITSPANGDSFVCGDLTVMGTYSTGSGTLSGITVEAPWAGGHCPVTIIDGSTFTVNCGDIIYGPSGLYDVEARITTTDGIQAMDTITISVGDCS
jgi:hypothetical protein